MESIDIHFVLFLDVLFKGIFFIFVEIIIFLQILEVLINQLNMVLIQALLVFNPVSCTVSSCVCVSSQKK